MNQLRLFILILITTALNATDIPVCNGDTINVRTFGAYGDGIHDDTKVLQKVLLEGALKSAFLYFPEGEYLISKQIGKDYALIVPSNTKMIGSSCRGTVFKLNNGHGGFTRMLKIKNAENIRINNFTFDGNLLNQALQEEHQSALAISSAKDIVIENSIFHSTGGDGIIIRGPKLGSKNITITNCYFHTNGRNGITLGSGFDNVNIQYCHFDVTNTHASPIDSEPTSGVCGNVKILHNSFISCKPKGSILTFGGRPWVNGYLFENNILDNVGLHMVRSRNVVVKNNYISISDSSKYAIRLIYGNENNVITGNEFYLHGSRIMQLTKIKGEFPENITFSNNKIEVLSTSLGIPFQLRGVQKIFIFDNTINFTQKLRTPLVTLRPTGPMLDIAIRNNNISNISELISIFRSINDNIDNLEVLDNTLSNSNKVKKRGERKNLNFLKDKNIIIQ